MINIEIQTLVNTINKLVNSNSDFLSFIKQQEFQRLGMGTPPSPERIKAFQQSLKPPQDDLSDWLSAL